MAHETHHGTENKSKTALSSSFWFVLILAGLFIAAVNFINVMSHDDGGHGAGHETHETHQPGTEAAGHGHETEAAHGTEAGHGEAGHTEAADAHHADSAAPQEAAHEGSH